ncbi:MAG TPA: TIM44-like domain-containing protein [Kofleriaceae bacterium]
MKRRAALLAGCAVLATAAIAIARPGGGESYSGGGGHGGGGGGGGLALFELVFYLLRFLFIFPQFGIPIVLIVVGFFVWNAYKGAKNKDWDSGPAAPVHRAIDLDDLRDDDPDFSRVLFEDFAFRLFATAQRNRHSAAALAAVGPYLDADAREALTTRDPVATPVEGVVIGAMRIVDYEIDERKHISIEFEANVQTKAHTYYSVETWQFSRAWDAKSKPPPKPGTTRLFTCPNCGAPWEEKELGTQVCASCNQAVDNGRFDWVVDDIDVDSIDERPPTLTEDVPERGTDLPTYRDSGVDAALEQLAAADPSFTRPALLARLDAMYTTLNTAWSRGDLGPARAYLSDSLFDYLQYWVTAYKTQGLRNNLVDMRITDREIAKVERDTYYDAITIRVFGTGKDFVVRSETGALVRGSKSRDRAYSEYWTLIRSAARKGPPHGDATCGNCGAPLKITMGGACEHCGAHVTAGEFDWVLSKIEQDDSYRG